MCHPDFLFIIFGLAADAPHQRLSAGAEDPGQCVHSPVPVPAEFLWRASGGQGQCYCDTVA